MDNEVIVTNKALKIDPKSKFTVKMNFGCETHVHKHIIDTCNSHRSKPLDKPIHKNVSQIIMEYGGTAYNAMKPVRIKKFMETFQPIIQGLRTMSHYKYCHRDIKCSNMLYNSVINKHVIIDFGMMTKFNKLYTNKEYPFLSFIYAYYPPEFPLMAYFYDQSQINTVDDMINDLEDNDNIKRFVQRNISEGHLKILYDYDYYRKRFEDDTNGFVQYVKTYLKKQKSIFCKKSKQTIISTITPWQKFQSI